MSRRAVITGIGVVAPNGIGTEAYWQATKEGRSAAENVSVLRCYLAHDLHGTSTGSIFQQGT